jgi:hypothetical protein
MRLISIYLCQAGGHRILYPLAVLKVEVAYHSRRPDIVVVILILIPIPIPIPILILSSSPPSSVKATAIATAIAWSSLRGREVEHVFLIGPLAVVQLHTSLDASGDSQGGDGRDI